MTWEAGLWLAEAILAGILLGATLADVLPKMGIGAKKEEDQK